MPFASGVFFEWWLTAWMRSSSMIRLHGLAVSSTWISRPSLNPWWMTRPEVLPDTIAASSNRTNPGRNHSTPGRPQRFQEMHYKFSMAMEELALEILQLLEETLGVTSGDFTRHWERLKRTLVRFNWYPPCEEPGLVLGAGSHTDPDIITILLQDEVGGLQILKDSKWIACKPLHGSFVVNVGDFFQVLSNDFLPSLQHRAVLNKEKARLSVVTFVLPKVDATIEPSSDLVDEDHPAAFRRLMFEEIINAAKEMKFKGKEVLSLFRV
ncbi:2-oxoacid-dependent oxygenase [Selaginella moellendorffii]|uniref:2-oxoacid-dependent oxygenase n=1 Tax=Selaginella moellendorffii TaxID=88036 RepID=D8R9B7_SELML|nr:2-oxoacid-dependent oxygenase [Selaginella moellendorffii]